MKKLWWKIPAIILASLLGIILLILIAIPLVLTSDRLTRWVNEYGTEYLVDGQVDVKKVDLSVWSTFPHAALTVDSLRITNRSIPDSVATLLNVEHLSGRLNLPALLIGRVSINHAEIRRPNATLWFGADSTQNSLSILPAAEPSKPSDEPLSLPDIRINSFRIQGDADLRYISVPDSMDLTLSLHRINLDGTNSDPQYQLLTNATANPLPFIRCPLSIILNGGISWEPSAPLAFALHDFIIGIDKVNTRTSLKADLSDGVRIDALDFELDRKSVV